MYKFLFGKKSYSALTKLNMLSIMLAPFFNNFTHSIDDGNGSVAEQELLEKVKKEAEDSVKEQLKSFKVEFADIAKKAGEGKLDSKELQDKLDELSTKSKEFTNTQLKTLKTSIDEFNDTLKVQGEEMRKSKEDGLPGKSVVKGIGDLLLEQLKAGDHLEEYSISADLDKKGLRIKGWDSMTSSSSIVMKAAIDMTTALALRPGADPGTSIGYLTDYSKTRDILIDLTRDIHLVRVLPTDPIVDKYMGVLIETEYFDGSAIRIEGAAAAASSIKFITKEFKVFDISTLFRVSRENLADIDRLVYKLNRIAPDRILSTLDGRILSATGDNSTDIEGMFVAGNFTDFSAATVDPKVPGANVGDAVRKMKLQANLADKDVNIVILHPSRVDELEVLKDADKNYLKSRGLVFDDNGILIRLHGLSVVVNKKIGVNGVAVMWNEAAEIGIREDISFEVGLNGNDLEEGMRTIVFHLRVAFGVGKAGSIIYSDDIDADVILMTA